MVEMQVTLDWPEDQRLIWDAVDAAGVKSAGGVRTVRPVEILGLIQHGNHARYGGRRPEKAAFRATPSRTIGPDDADRR